MSASTGHDGGRVVLVVGGSSGIGLAAALQLAARGDRLVLAARGAEALDRAAQRCRETGAQTVETAQLDVLDGARVTAVVDGVLREHGRLDAVVHTATVMAYGTVEDMPPDVFTTVVDTAVHGTLHLAREVLPVFRRQGHGVLAVVNSLLGSVTVPNMGAYSTAKWAQRGLVRTLQQEVRDAPGVHVCLASPGSINTPIYYQAANYTGRSARPPVPVLQPERAGAVLAGLLDRPRQNVSVPIGPANPVVITGYRLVPWLYDRLVGPLFRLAALTGERREPGTGNVHDAVPALEEVHGRWPARTEVRG